MLAFSKNSRKVDQCKKTSAAYYFRLHQLIYQNSLHLAMFEGKIEVNESYFGDDRKGKRGWRSRQNRIIRAYQT